MLTPKEQGKKLLEQEQQEKLRLQHLAEEAEQEEKDRKRRLKQRQTMAFIADQKLREEEAQAQQEIREREKEFFHRHTRQTQQFTRMQLNSLTRHEACVAEFLFAGQSREELAQHEQQMKAANLDISEYQAVAVAELCARQENIELVEQVFQGKEAPESLKQQRRDSLNRADEALADFSRGDIRKLEQTLREGLTAACHTFVNANDPLSAVHWSKQINGLLSVVTTHPILFKNGVDTPLLEAATGMAALGRVMENGMKALDQLCTAQMNGTPVTQEKEMNLQAQVLLMQQTDLQRSNEQYRKLFAKEYHPKKGFPEKKMQNLLKKLNGSQAMHVLSAMEPERRMFAITDTQSRKTLCEGLFIPHAEKTVTQPERIMKKDAPVLSFPMGGKAVRK